jgi:hypothetical protein
MPIVSSGMLGYKQTIIFSMILLNSFQSFSQESKALLTLYFNEVRDGKYPAIPKQLSLSENSKITLEALPQYLNDTVAIIRSKAYGLVQLSGSNARQSAMREDAVTKLLEGCKDKDAGNAGLALDYLTSFINKDFNAAAKDSVKTLFKRRPPHFDKVIRIAGFLEIKDLSDEIRQLTTNGNPRQQRWAATLALARMKDAAAQKDMMTRAKKIPVNDDVVYQIFPDLIYSRDREAIDYMIEVMQSDAKNCTSANAERESMIPCGYRIMEQLAPIIKSYPLELDESGDIKTNDYLAALASVRYWFSKNKNYEILRDTY